MGTKAVCGLAFGFKDENTWQDEIPLRTLQYDLEDAIRNPHVIPIILFFVGHEAIKLEIFHALNPHS